MELQIKKAFRFAVDDGKRKWKVGLCECVCSASMSHALFECIIEMLGKPGRERLKMCEDKNGCRLWQRVFVEFGDII